MVNFASTAIFGILALALGASGAPNQQSGKLITLEDIKNAQPVVPEVTDPTKKALAGDSQDNSTLLQARPDLAQTVDEAKKTVPDLLADDKPPKPTGKMARRDLEKRAKETCEIFTNKKDPRIQATRAALILAAQKSCQLWFPGNGLWAVPENTSRKAVWFNHLVLEYHVRDTTCSPYRSPIHEYYIVSQAICIAQFARLFTLAETVCAGDFSGVSSENDRSVPIWYDWKTFA
ncbi:hypothetical protein ABVK25_007763 [Lepraria finkii]|uniref:Uncharacterized protein n=1 Tax=Lepraria finkii TaxID=1340010 RepID=A0ABR4B4W1_9LECA